MKFDRINIEVKQDILLVYFIEIKVDKNINYKIIKIQCFK